MVTQEVSKIDIGCGERKKEGYFGLDIRDVKGVDLVHDLLTPWPFADSSIEDINCHSVLEHFDVEGRAFIVNEAYRVLIKGSSMTVITPYGFCERAYGDPTHKWPPIVAFWYYYLNKEWRDSQAQHCHEIYKCNFNTTWGYLMHPEFQMRSSDSQMFAANWYTNAAMELHATMVKL